MGRLFPLKSRRYIVPGAPSPIATATVMPRRREGRGNSGKTLESIPVIAKCSADCRQPDGIAASRSDMPHPP